VLAVNLLVPPSLKITGPSVDPEGLARYIATVARRAASVGVKTLVFGSGAARAVPAGSDLATAAAHGMMLVIEPLHRAECNIVNSVAEAARYARSVGHPNCQVLLDTYHLWMEDEPVENVRRVAGTIRHVHVADLQGRVAPGQSGKSDYRPLFRVLKDAAYPGSISFEGAPMAEFDVTAPKVLEFLRGQWASA
jgi:D-psicose/D-tagatose/L-ribulose 3-epimerase